MRKEESKLERAVLKETKLDRNFPEVKKISENGRGEKPLVWLRDNARDPRGFF